MMREKPTTEAFIAALAQSPPPKRFAPGRMVALVLAATVLGAVAWLSLMGIRPDLAAALIAPVTLAKTLIPAVLAGIAIRLAVRSAYPSRPIPLVYLLAPLPVVLALLAVALAATPTPLLGQAMIGSTVMQCLSVVVTLSLLPMLAGMVAMKRGASTRPALSGALLGLAAGAGAATGYSLACTEDSPLFYLVWYGLAITVAGIIGAIAGSRLLRW